MAARFPTTSLNVWFEDDRIKVITVPHERLFEFQSLWLSAMGFSASKFFQDNPGCIALVAINKISNKIIGFLTATYMTDFSLYNTFHAMFVKHSESFITKDFKQISPTLYISSIGVAYEHRRNKVATRLLIALISVRDAIKEGKMPGLPACGTAKTITGHFSTEDGIQFASKLGFQRTLEGQFPNGEHSYFYFKFL